MGECETESFAQPSYTRRLKLAHATIRVIFDHYKFMVVDFSTLNWALTHRQRMPKGTFKHLKKIIIIQLVCDEPGETKGNKWWHPWGLHAGCGPHFAHFLSEAGAPHISTVNFISLSRESVPTHN